MGQLGVITGLASEGDCLRGLVDPLRCQIRCAGADAGRAKVLSWELVEQGCSALLSFGLAGGLDPRLAAGHVVLAERVLGEGAALDADPSWIGRSMAALAPELPVTGGSLVGVAAAVTSAREKERLYAATQAVALDMESHAVAAMARELGVPFLAIRVIADTARQSVPSWLAGVVDQDGTISLSAFFRGLARHPADMGEVFRLAGANRRAMASLRRVALLLGPGLGFL